MNETASGYRVLALMATFLATLAATAMLDPIAQDPAYHAFADTRTCFKIPNFGDTASNIGFAIVGFWGLFVVLGPAGRRIFDNRRDALPYMVFFAGVALVAVGSAYYHLAPDNNRLFWDRLPMTVAFMAFFSAFVADRVAPTGGMRWLLPVLVAAGALSLLYWVWTEAAGRGDLRFYGLVQFYPIIALPLLLWLFPHGRYTDGKYLFWAIFWYTVAKALEHFDTEVFALLGNTVSGHTLKHLAAAVSTAVVLRMIRRPRDPVAAATPPTAPSTSPSG